MILKQLSILNYKNIAQAEVAFSHKINCFFGNNGMGKTNLLDAIHYLSFCKSYINTPDSQLVKDGEEMCMLQGFYDYEGQQEEIFCGIRRLPHVVSYHLIVSSPEKLVNIIPLFPAF